MDYGLFLTRKIFISEKFLDDTFLTQLVLSHASDNTTSQNIGGTDAWAVPPPKNFWRPSPKSTLSLRPWADEYLMVLYTLKDTAVSLGDLSKWPGTK